MRLQIFRCSTYLASRPDRGVHSFVVRTTLQMVNILICFSFCEPNHLSTIHCEISNGTFATWKNYHVSKGQKKSREGRGLLRPRLRSGSILAAVLFTFTAVAG